MTGNIQVILHKNPLKHNQNSSHLDKMSDSELGIQIMVFFAKLYDSLDIIKPYNMTLESDHPKNHFSFSRIDNPTRFVREYPLRLTSERVFSQYLLTL